MLPEQSCQVLWGSCGKCAEACSSTSSGSIEEVVGFAQAMYSKLIIRCLATHLRMHSGVKSYVP